MDWLPETALPPVHEPEAEQELAFVEDQVSIAVPPLAIDAGLAVSDTLGSPAGLLHPPLSLPQADMRTAAAIAGTIHERFRFLFIVDPV